MDRHSGKSSYKWTSDFHKINDLPLVIGFDWNHNLPGETEEKKRAVKLCKKKNERKEKELKKKSEKSKKRERQRGVNYLSWIFSKFILQFSILVVKNHFDY